MVEEVENNQIYDQRLFVFLPFFQGLQIKGYKYPIHVGLISAIHCKFPWDEYLRFLLDTLQTQNRNQEFYTQWSKYQFSNTPQLLVESST